ncbi:MAG: HD domain-containing protein [Defluviitaleaceae bacterium]|nr:HD domain-containing protein [Defluviitaleaceae bacterium]MCL2275007.1 HD domain-containing protein [Defluviitaleaceae bacterium]
MRKIQYTDLFSEEIKHEHSRLVSRIAGLIAKNALFSRDEVTLIESAAILHDVGKNFIPKPLLLKKSKLTAHEYKIMQSHTLAGATQILQTIRTLLAAYIIALQHHERVDGTGYAGMTNIHPYAKVVAVADVFDSLLAKRPYKQAWPPEKAVFYMQENIHKQFEASYVTALIESIDEILDLYEGGL